MGLDFSFTDVDVDQEPLPTVEEVQQALREIPGRKAPGTDSIPIELWKEAADAMIKPLTELCKAIWHTLSWPRDWKTSIFLPIPKKGNLRECENYRTIALISHASKVILKVIQKRLHSYVEAALSTVQAGFRNGRGTRDHISNLRRIMEECKEYNKPLFICFIDYTKAFDCVDHDALLIAMRRLGVPEHLLQLVKSLYGDQQAAVRTAMGLTEEFAVNKGVRQGCILSPQLFNLYGEYIMRLAGLDSAEEGLHFAGLVLNNLRYADDTTLLAESEQELRVLLRKVQEASKELGLSLNLRKTKIISTDDLRSFRVGNEVIEVVDHYVFLGSLISQDGGTEQEIKRRIQLGRSAMNGLTKIMKDRDISLKTKIRIVRAMVFPVMTYGAESWVVRKQERRRIDAFELWVWRRALRIPWTAHVTNAEVIQRIAPTATLEAFISSLKLKYFGHIMRADGSLEKQIILGYTSGKRLRGRPKMRWIDTIKTLTGLSIQQLKEAVRNRIDWRLRIQEITKSRSRLDGT